MKRIVLILIIIGLAIAAINYFIRYNGRAHDKEIILFGNVDVRQVDLGFRVSGRVIKMPFQEGDFVRRGELVGLIDDQPYADQVKQARANYDSIKINLENSEKLLRRREQLISGGSISQEDLDNAMATHKSLGANLDQAEASVGIAETNLKDTQIFAPSDGIVLTRIREPGSVVRATEPIYTITLPDPIWIRAYVPEPLLGIIYPGMSADVFIDSNRDKIYKGHIGFISPVAEFTPKTVETAELRTDLVYRLRIIADNPDNGLLQGMPVTVRLNRK